MFAEACRLVSRFTRPVIIFTRFYDKTVKCGCGAFIVLNDEGWILTAAHLWKSFFAHKEHSKQIAEYNEKVRLSRAIRDSTQNRRVRGCVASKTTLDGSRTIPSGGDGMALRSKI